MWSNRCPLDIADSPIQCSRHNRIGKTISDVTWDLEGQTLPAPNAVEEQDNRLFFTAPRVEQDSAIRVEAQVSYSDGTAGTDGCTDAGQIRMKNHRQPQMCRRVDLI